MADAQATLAPVSGTARIDILDILRGIAILGIFFMNIPFMGVALVKIFVDAHSIGWTPVDAASWMAVQVLLEGTQRGLLEILFGAGMMVLTARAMTPDGPVAIADLYWRRNLWLLGFGLVDVFVLLWAGDILHIYALAALFLFPFRKLGAKWLLLLGLGFALFTAVSGGFRYVERADLMQRAHLAEKKQAAKLALTPAETKAVADWKKAVDNRAGRSDDFKQLREAEAKGRSGGFIAYAAYNIGTFVLFVVSALPVNVGEAFCTMLLGIALWKWQVIQGGRSAGFYLLLMLACYVPGFALRWIAAKEMLTMVPIPRVGWITIEFARVAVAVGHIALVNLMVKSGAGRAILAPFKAAGRTAFSLYFIQQIVGLWILFAPWGVGLWDKLSWSGLYAVALGVIALQLVIANLWVRAFANGPLEWAWRSLAYVRWQPFRKRKEEQAEG
ncbi:MAG: DUF418 domain-containing protein [Pseudomonadota bacterium]